MCRAFIAAFRFTGGDPFQIAACTSNLGYGFAEANRGAFGQQRAGAIGAGEGIESFVDRPIRLSFNHTTGGLKARVGNSLKGFAIAARDKKFVWADGKIDGAPLASDSEISKAQIS